LKTKAIVILAIICIISFLTTSCVRSQDVVILDEEGKSYFSDFSIDENKVHVFCRITLKNNSAETVDVKLNAFMPKDVENGLLLQPVLQGINLEDDTPVFRVPAESEKSFYVDFIGEHGNNDIKQDRLLPEIRIALLD